MRKLSLLLVLMLFTAAQILAQRTITGTVRGDDGKTLPAVTVLVNGDIKQAAQTDIDGKYSIKVPANGKFLRFSFVGMKQQDVALDASNTLDVSLSGEASQLEGVVVTALGISREKKSLGYSTQEVKGDNLTAIKSSNFVGALSGKVAGIQIKKNTNMGGSTNVIMRGNKSLTGNNQVLYVIDGVPIDNTIGSYDNQKTGATGYDYGNAASDINPDDIESLNVLKGSAATALYGSRASGGVIMITTKKGSTGKGIGVTVSSNVTFSSIDKSTFPTYQKEYGAGYAKVYGPNKNAYFLPKTKSGKKETNDPVNDPFVDWVPMTEDASFGAKFDNHPVWGWYSVDPESPWYKQSKPWAYGKNDALTFFETPISYTNSVSIDKSTDKGNMRISYTNFKTNALMPNSNMLKNNFLVNGSWNITNKLTASATANFTRQEATGRNSTGYNDNIVTNMRQWYQTNLDYADLKEAYFKTRRNLTWNYNNNLNYPIYTDNPYWQRYENYQNDSRNRTIGNIALNYKILDWLDIFGRVSLDTYAEIQEERRAVGSVGVEFGVSRAKQMSGYQRRDITYSEYNYDLMLKFNKALNEDFSMSGILGATERRTNYTSIQSSTNGGLAIPKIYSLQNSISPLPFPKETASRIGVRGFYGSVSLGYKNMLYLDGTFRGDYASTLPQTKSVYYYPSITGAFVFSEVLKYPWLSFGKVRLNFAKVGNLAGFDYLMDKYSINAPFFGRSYELPDTKNNSELKSESTNSLEAGLEMKFFQNRLGFDLALYKTNSFDQIMPVTLSQTSGYNYRYVNAGEIENKGIELSINAVPVEVNGFSWNVNLNFATNANKVIKLYPNITNLQLASFQGGVTLNAMEGQPYGVLRGKDYTYDDKGNKIINAATGKPVLTSTATSVLGKMNPDWTGGIRNSFAYKGLALSFLIDIQKGGSLFSLDMYYGMGSGLYPETVGNNELGNPVRDILVFNEYDADGKGIPSKGYKPNTGGYLIKGVNVTRDTDGKIISSTPNTTRVNGSNSDGWGNSVEPSRAFVYDATFVKLREVAISYDIPVVWLKKVNIKGATVSVVGSNLWIIHKKLPYADPEAGLSAGNVQGYSIGSLPSTRDFGFNLKFNF